MKKISNQKLRELNKLESISKIRKVIQILRDPIDGCPWDLKQDYNSLAPYSIEEAYELVDAIEKNDIEEIKNELGDLLLQVILISQVADDKGDFNFDDVANGISKKIIRRHPQIFDKNYKENDLPQESWEKIKKLEKNKSTNKKNTLDQIEKNIPTLLKSLKIQKKAASLNFDWENETQVLNKIDEEIHELKDAFKLNDKKMIEEEIGDLFFTIINLSRRLNLDPEQTIRQANKKFTTRFNEMENFIEYNNLKWHNLKKHDFKNLWKKVKNNQRGINE